MTQEALKGHGAGRLIDSNIRNILAGLHTPMVTRSQPVNNQSRIVLDDQGFYAVESATRHDIAKLHVSLELALRTDAHIVSDLCSALRIDDRRRPNPEGMPDPELPRSWKKQKS